ncbi:MAG: molybdenum cofactor guanylyltransferase [Chthoniobacterales bacterium]
MPWSAVLLAGGKSSRMGCDKAFLEIGGRPLWQHQLETLAHLFPARMMISGPSRKEWSAYEIVPDEQANAGPLAGIAAALKTCGTSHLLVLAVDLPRMTSDYLGLLLKDCTEDQGVVPRGDDFFEPLAAVYPASCTSLAEGNLRSDDFSMQNFVRRGREQQLLLERVITQAEIPLFSNLNSPADL